MNLKINVRFDINNKDIKLILFNLSSENDNKKWRQFLQLNRPKL